MDNLQHVFDFLSKRPDAQESVGVQIYRHGDLKHPMHYEYVSFSCYDKNLWALLDSMFNALHLGYGEVRLEIVPASSIIGLFHVIVSEK